MKLSYKFSYIPTVLMVIATITTHGFFYCAEQPRTQDKNAELKAYFRTFSKLPQQTQKEKEDKLEYALVYYDKYYNFKKKRPEKIDKLLGVFRADADLLNTCQQRLVDLLAGLEPLDYLMARGDADLITREPAISNFNRINFLLDVIAPDTQLGATILGFLETMPVFLHGHEQEFEHASFEAGFEIPEMFAYVLTRLVLTGADRLYIQRVGECIAEYMSKPENMGMGDRLEFESLMRKTFNYFLSKLRSQEIRISDEFIRDLEVEIALLLPTRESASALSLPANVRLERSAISQAALGSVITQSGWLG